MKTGRDTRVIELGSGILDRTAAFFRSQFEERPALIVADSNTLAAAGEQVRRSFSDPPELFVFSAEGLYAEERFVVELEEVLKKGPAIPIAVGSGVINDLTKLAAHRCGRPYMCVATAASMDGYTAFGASISYRGSKQTFSCPAPAVVVADLEVIRQAPRIMSAWGYADLLAKITAGADWILADALGIEPIHAEAWNLVQGRLWRNLADPAGVGAGELSAVAGLMEGLVQAGFAMQAMGSSRPASGAEHQFSHLWDMQHHTHEGEAPSHGFKVGIATLAIARLYERLLSEPLPDPDAAAATWPERGVYLENVRRLLAGTEFVDHAVEESNAKYADQAIVRQQLRRLHELWPQLSLRLADQLGSAAELKRMLQEAGAPTEPEQIGITRERLRKTFGQACCIRRRFTLLDLMQRMGRLSWI